MAEIIGCAVISGTMSPSLKRLKDLVEDLVQQLTETVPVLDQRHFRLLVNLSSAEKVNNNNSIRFV